MNLMLQSKSHGGVGFRHFEWNFKQSKLLLCLLRQHHPNVFNHGPPLMVRSDLLGVNKLAERHVDNGRDQRRRPGRAEHQYSHGTRRPAFVYVGEGDLVTGRDALRCKWKGVGHTNSSDFLYRNLVLTRCVFVTNNKVDNVH